MKKSRGSFLSTDILELSVLPRVPVKSLVRFKCVSKRWNALISSNQFFIMQQYKTGTILRSLNVELCTFMHQSKYYLRDGSSVSVPDLIPREGLRDIVAWCNGLVALACRPINAMAHRPTYEEDLTDHSRSQFFVGSPVYQDWKLIPMSGCPVNFRGFGLAFDPLESVSRYELVFLVQVKYLVNNQNKFNSVDEYGFYVFSSESGKWKGSTAVVSVQSSKLSMAAFLSGVVYWIDNDVQLIWYDTKKDCSGVLPLPTGSNLRSGCLNELNGKIFYTRIVVGLKIEVWKMKDLQWSMSHHINIEEVVHMNPEVFGQISKLREEFRDTTISDALFICVVTSVGFDGKEVFFRINSTPYRYNIETGEPTKYPTLRYERDICYFYRANLIRTPE